MSGPSGLPPRRRTSLVGVRAVLLVAVVILTLWSLPQLLGAGQTFDVYLPWDDGAATVIDLSRLHPRPAGARGFIRATEDGHLADDAGRVRFWVRTSPSAATSPRSHRPPASRAACRSTA